MSTFVELDSTFRDREKYPSPADFTVDVNQLNGWFAAARTVRAYPQVTQTKQPEFATSVELTNLTLPYNDAFTNLERVYVDFHCKSHNDAFLVNTINGMNRDARFVVHFDKIQYATTTTISPQTVVINTNIVNGSNVVNISQTSVSNFTPIPIGTSVTGTGISGGTIVSSVNNSTQLVLNQPAISTGNYNLSFTYNTTTIESVTPAFIHYKSAHDDQVMRFRRNDSVIFRVFDNQGKTLVIPGEPSSPDNLNINPMNQICASFNITPFTRDNDFANHLTDTSTF